MVLTAMLQTAAPLEPSCPPLCRPARRPARCRRPVALLLGLAAAGLVPTVTRADEPSSAEITANMLAGMAIQTLAPEALDPDAQDSAVVPEAETPATDASDPVHPDQYVRGQILLDLALEQTPGDAELWRLRADLADRLGDRATQAAALRRYVDLRPDDDAVRLRLIMFELSDLETLDGRLALLEQRLAETDAPGRTPALTSRLASAAAHAAREIGDDTKFVQYLRLAGRGGTGNADAARLTYAFAESRGANEEQLAAAAVNLVQSDPVGAASRRLLAARLAGLAAYDRSVEQYTVSTRVPDAPPLSPDELAGWVRALIGAGEMDQASAQLAAYEAYAAENPEARPPLELTLLRCVLDPDGDAGRAAYERVAAALQPAVDDGDVDAALDLAWVTALFGPDTQPVAELLRDRSTQDPRYARASGFVYLREGAASWARKAFEGVAEDDPVSAYGLALISGVDEAGVARQLQTVIRRDGNTFGAALAAYALRSEDRPILPTAGGRSVISLMNKLPSTLWRFDVSRNPWVGVKAEMERHRMLQLEPVAARITLQNFTDLPLPLNDSAGVGHTAFVALSLYSGGRPAGSAPTIVVDLGRRLVLMPGERRSFEVRLDRSAFGVGLARVFPAAAGFNGTFIVGPEVDTRGGFTTGPLGGIDTIRSAQVLIEPATTETVENWIGQLTAGPGAADDRAWYSVLARAGASRPQMVPPQVDATLARRAADALLAAYSAGDARTQSWILLTLVAPADSASVFRGLFDQAVRSPDELVRVAHLASHVDDPQDPALTSAIRDGGPRLQRFGEALREALKRNPGGR